MLFPRLTQTLRAPLIALLAGGCLVTDLIRTVPTSTTEPPGDMTGPSGDTGETGSTGETGPTGCAGDAECASGLCVEAACVSAPAACATEPAWLADRPVILASDRTSGPATGGDGNRGVYLTLYGERLGAGGAGSKVTIGGTDAVIFSWSENTGARGLDVIVVQAGAGTTSGDVHVWVNGLRSNSLPYVVRGGNIYYFDPASTSASDSSSGTAREQAWKTFGKVAGSVASGDTVYFLSDLLGAGTTTYSGASGTAEAPIVFSGIPRTDGARAHIAGTGPSFRHQSGDHVTYANLHITHYFDGDDVGVRIVGCLLEGGDGEGGLAVQSNADIAASTIRGYVRIANYQPISTLGTPSYLWNELDGALGQAPSYFELNVTGAASKLNGARFVGNLFHRLRAMHALELTANENPSPSPFDFVNNVFVRDVAAGAQPPFLALDNDVNTPVVLTHNTFLGVQLGTRVASGWHPIVLQNNIIDLHSAQPAGEGALAPLLFIASTSGSPMASDRQALLAGMAAFTGDRNLWNVSAVPSFDTQALTGASALDADFAPSATSPAFNAALGSSPCGDFTGTLRSAGRNHLGAVAH